MVSGSLYLLAERLRHDPTDLADLSSRFDATIHIVPTASIGLSPHQLERLERGRPLIETTNAGRTALMHYWLSNESILEVRLNTVTELQAQATAYLLIEDWQRSGLSIEDFLARVQPHFGFPLNLVSLNSLRFSDAELARLQYGDVLVRINIEGKEAEALVMVPGQNLAVRLGPLYEFDPYSWQAMVVITIIAIVALGIGVYWVVNSFEVRLRKLEQATSRLAQGHMNARVAIEGSDPVSRLGTAFNKMAEHIQRLMAIQREMVRAVSHELRTPVARIRFGMQIIEDSVDDPFVAKQLSGMDDDIQELDELIDEILTYARLEEGGPLLDFQRVNVAAIAEQVVEEARPPAHVEVHYAGVSSEHALMAQIEPRYIHRAVQNLVGNAGRYAASKVRVSCAVGNDTCRIDVEDDGPGIPEEHWERVFTPFARLDDSRTRASGGYGLGLSIVRRIVYWHGGRAMVSKSESLGGAKFSLIWPRRHQE